MRSSTNSVSPISRRCSKYRRSCSLASTSAHRASSPRDRESRRPLRSWA
jgi:hypothetical protein